MNNKLMLLAGVSALTFASCNQQKEEKAVEKEYEAFATSALDTTVHACEDFFQYTAGGFIENNPIPDSESRWGRFNILIEDNNKRLREILMTFTDKTDLKKGSDQQLVGDLFHTGIDTGAIDKRGIKDIEPLLKAVDNIQNQKEYFTKAGEMKLLGFGNPFSAYVSPDKKNVNMNVLYASQSGLSLPDRDYYLKDDSASKSIRTKFKSYVADMLAMTGSDREKAKEMANRIYSVEESIAKNQMSRVDQRNPKLTYNKMAVSEFMEMTPNIGWEQYFNTLGIETDTVIVNNPGYMKSLDSMYTATDLADWKLLMHWKVVNGSANYLTSELEQRRFDFYGTTINGKKEMKPRWRRVMNRMGGLDEQLGHLFVDEHFSADSKAQVEGMVEDLRAAFRERINGLTWMTPETKEKALEKLDAFTYKIGYPDKWKDYSDLDISRESFAQNMLTLSEYKTRENLDKLNKPVDKSEWYMGAHVVNAYYNPYNNEIVFPAGILQPPFFNPDADPAINYGGIGGVIGHEFTHGFDDKGSLYGADGNLNDWWTETDRQRFDSLVNKVVEQYSSYEPLEGLNINGKLTVGENIADFGGITLAYHAYKKSIEGQPEPKPIDGFSDDQRVFLGWAQVWQMNSTKEYIRNRVMTDPHSPARYRVNGPLSNMVEFEKAFACNSHESFVRSDSAKIVIW
ncbi:MAG: M13 family metallopeptidase [Salibacter sp.]|uniref:M13 family metallopeptidase n=1 Tax=Salibacter sp. TaxID=2010995 RepID=UPI0028704FB7|nr:M13 family metallopeptidase [Salibacter sp.]MDR9399395.1 M13 family metallopeptidase [Salibacter sp.]